jgi:hypothetical protein
MITATVWLTKLILSHLVTDFILQPKSWIKDRIEKHYASARLYVHGFITAVFALLMTGWQYWVVALIILTTHILIDGWKSYRKSTTLYFLLDQFMHLMVIVGCWYFTFFRWCDLQNTIQQVNTEANFWKTLAAFVFLTAPASVLIGHITQQWRDKIQQDTDSLANAGKWIGMIERIIILIFVSQNQYAAIGLLVAAKGIIRFNEKERQEIKTEYLVIGTLLSIGLAIVSGLLVKW